MSLRGEIKSYKLFLLSIILAIQIRCNWNFPKDNEYLFSQWTVAGEAKANYFLSVHTCPCIGNNYQLVGQEPHAPDLSWCQLFRLKAYLQVFFWLQKPQSLSHSS